METIIYQITVSDLGVKVSKLRATEKPNTYFIKRSIQDSRIKKADLEKIKPSIIRNGLICYTIEENRVKALVAETKAQFEKKLNKRIQELHDVQDRLAQPVKIMDKTEDFDAPQIIEL